MLAGSEKGYPPAGWPAANLMPGRDLPTPTRHPTARRTTFASCPLSSKWMSQCPNKGSNNTSRYIWIFIAETSVIQRNTWRHVLVNTCDMYVCVCVHTHICLQNRSWKTWGEEIARITTCIYIEEDAEIALTNQVVAMSIGFSWFTIGISGEFFRTRKYEKLRTS